MKTKKLKAKKKQKRTRPKRPAPVAIVPPPTELRSKAKRLRELARAAEEAAGATGYESHREAMAAVAKAESTKGRDIDNPSPADGFFFGYGAIPIADPGRRARCRNNLKLFCDTYNPETFFWRWSDDAIHSIRRIEEAVRLGALYAFAEARGSGKTARVRMAALWALAYSHCGYAYVIAATEGKANDTLDAIKKFVRLPVFSADFPEISYPILRLQGIANRARGQMCRNVSTAIEWTADHIVLPTMPPPKGWRKEWALRSDGMVPTSGSVFSTSGLTGEGIRGSLKTLTTGRQVRPDFVLLDDPQTSESAGSLSQNDKRERIISADVLGMAGPGARLGAVMPCTIIRPGDAMDRMTDRTKNPLWRGSRSGILKALPKNLADWDGYFEVYRRCAQKEPPDITEATEYYVAHRERLDDGAVASWLDRKLPGEASAIQHAMNLYCRDRRAFMAEYMNQPAPIDLDAIDDLDAGEICRKLNNYPRGVCPPDVTRVTAFVDVGNRILFWCIAGWSENFGGYVLDYGTYPRQTRTAFVADDARPSLTDLLKGHNEDARVFAGVKETVALVVGRTFQRENGGDLRVERCLVDSGRWPKAIASACRQSPHVGVLTPSKGWGIGSGRKPMSSWQLKEGQRRGDHWVMQPNTDGGYGRDRKSVV